MASPFRDSLGTNFVQGCDTKSLSQFDVAREDWFHPWRTPSAQNRVCAMASAVAAFTTGQSSGGGGGGKKGSSDKFIVSFSKCHKLLPPLILPSEILCA